MEEIGKRLTCRAAKELDLVEYLARLGFAPAKIKGDSFWYLSPLRQERTPSFKVSRKINRWYDFGIGQGGSIIEFATQYYNCTIAELLLILSGLVLPQTARSLISYNPEPLIAVKSVKPLAHPALSAYLLNRKIPFSLASQYCVEVSYQIDHRNYFAIGFKNDHGGYELRNQFFKGSCSPKSITSFKKGSETIAVFEGFIDFLSYLALTSHQPSQVTDFVILNGLGFLNSAIPTLNSYQRVFLFLDNDKAGQNSSMQVVQSDPLTFTNLSDLYNNCKDLNNFLCIGGALDYKALPAVLKPP